MKIRYKYILIIVILTIIFNTNFFGYLALEKGRFQYDSEDLAISSITAEYYNINDSWVGLGRLYSKNIDKEYIAEDIYVNLSADKSDLRFGEYRSQLGLQGKFYTLISGLIYNQYLIEFFRWLNSFLLASVIVSILYLLKIKYNNLMAIVWGCVFILSPHILNFSHNLYWVEFTWFVPMLLGLLVATDEVKFRYKNLIITILVFLSIFVKSLCGYEYLSTIMIGMIVFLLSDIIFEFYKKDFSKLKGKIKILAILSICGFIGFTAALSLHGYYRGNGCIVTGIQDIYNRDVLRRTIAGNRSNFYSDNKVIMESIDVPTSKVIARYFKPYKEKQNVVIKTVGKLFLPSSVLALFIMVYRCKYRNKYNQTENLQIFSLFLISLFGTLSWIILAKSHSSIHFNLNLVLWYFGYCQMLVYILVNTFIRFIGCNCKKFLINDEYSSKLKM